MSTQTHSQALAAEIVALAAIVAGLDLVNETNHVNLSLSREGFAKAEIDVHECQPEQLELALETYDQAKASTDADGIVRRVEVELPGASVTFYRR
jgi:hypothetical protein